MPIGGVLEVDFIDHPLCPVTRGVGYPRLLNERSFSIDDSNTLDVRMADVVATYLFNYDEKVLARFLDPKCTYLCLERSSNRFGRFRVQKLENTVGIYFFSADGTRMEWMWAFRVNESGKWIAVAAEVYGYVLARADIDCKADCIIRRIPYEKPWEKSDGASFTLSLQNDETEQPEWAESSPNMDDDFDEENVGPGKESIIELKRELSAMRREFTTRLTILEAEKAALHARVSELEAARTSEAKNDE